MLSVSKIVDAPGSSVSSPIARQDLWSRSIILLLCLGVIVLSTMLSVGQRPDQVIVPLLNRPLPPLCQWKMLTGLDCPGCGLTRSFIALAHGQFAESFRFNPAGPIWFAFLALQVPYQALQLYRIGRGKRPLNLRWWGQGMIYLAVAALIGQWALRQWGWL